MTKLDHVVYDFINESINMPVGEFEILSEETKIDTVQEMANQILSSIKSCLGDIDLTDINRSRGDIKNYVNLNYLQTAISKLSQMALNADLVNNDLVDYTKELIQAISNLNKLSPQFKEAYRSKKTLTMLKYISVVLSLLSSVSYIISSCIDFKDPDHLKLKQKFDITDIAALNTLKAFNASVNSGEINSMFADVNTMREYYCEYSSEELMTICEAVSIVDFLNTGINNFNKSFDSKGRIGAVIAKMLGAVVLLLSLREVFYMLSNSKTKVGEMVNQIKTFTNMNSLTSVSALGKFITANNKIAANAETATHAAEEHIQQENKKIIQAVNSKPADNYADTAFVPVMDNSISQPTTNLVPDIDF